MAAAALEVFHRGHVGREAGLILADTKYEFGLATDGSLMLIDEMHTPDSSRSGSPTPTRTGSPPARSRRASTRRSSGGRSPTSATAATASADLPDDVWTATSARYIDAYERLTGLPFEPGSYPVAERIVANLEELG